MHFKAFATTLLSLGHIALVTADNPIPINIDRKNCEVGGPWISPSFTGNDWKNTPDYQKFCQAGWVDGEVLTGVRIWKARWQVHALQFQWGGKDNWGPIYGQAENPNEWDKESKWDASDKVFIRLWANKPDDGNPVDAVGKIRIEVDGKDPLEIGADNGKVGAENIFDGGAKKIIAVAGAHGAWISTLQFHYLESKVVDASVTSMSFQDAMNQYNDKNRPDADRGLQQIMVGNLYVKNSNPEGGQNLTYNMNPKVEKVTSKGTTRQMTHTVGVGISTKMSTKVGVPSVAEETVEWGIDVHYDFSYMESDQTTEQATWSFPWTVSSTMQGIAPQTAVHCTVQATMGTFESDYTGKITAILENGNTFEYNDRGHYKSIGYANGISECKSIPLSEVPNGEGEEANGPPPGQAPTKRSMRFRA